MSGGERPILVTGGAGFIGSNLADRLARMGHRVLVFDSLARAGVEENLAWLRRRHGERITPIIADIRDRAALAEAAGQAGAVFHFAAQVAVTTSMQDPREDFEINLLGTFHLLEVLRRRAAPPPLLFASTNKVYGNLGGIAVMDDGARYRPADPALATHGIGEDRPLDFHTPYGCSKGAADQYVLDYARSFGLPASVLRMSCIYGRRQRGTEDQGWVAHFLLRVMQGQPITIYGDGRQVRDVLWIDDAVEAYIAAWQRIEAVRGQAFNLGGGTANAVTLLQVIARIEAVLGRKPALRFEDWRPGDQRYFVADTRRLRAALGLGAPRDWRSGIVELARSFGVERSDHETAVAAQ
jgi:CDP-paratose 2-epimerase